MSPWKVRCPCRTPGCKELTTSGRCDAHQRDQYKAQDAGRGSSAARGYGAAHRRRRAYVLARDPLCKECLRATPQRLTPSREADHIVPLAEGGAEDVSNMQGLCRPCHSRKTARSSRGLARSRS